MNLAGLLLAWTFLGLPLATLAPLALGLAAATTALYMLRLRRRPIVVPFLDLWEKELQERSAEQLRSRLRRLLSLLLQLSLLSLLLLALADPRPDAFAEPEESLVVLIDTSASMGAPAQEPSGASTATRLDRALMRLKEHLETRGPRDEVLLVEMAQDATPLGPWTRSDGDLAADLARLYPKGESANLPGALRVAREALTGRDHRRILVVSDGALSDDALAAFSEGPSDTTLQFLPPPKGVSGRQDNVGISALSARRYPLDPQHFEVLLEVENTGETRAEVEVLFFRPDRQMKPGEVLEARRLEVPAGGREAIVIPDLSEVEQGIICHVSRVDGGDNWLELDDTAFALLRKRKPLEVLIVGEENTFLDAALLSNGGLIATRIPPLSYPPDATFDLVIFDQVSPARSKSTGPALYLGVDANQDPAHSPLELGPSLSLFGFDTWDKRSRVFRFIDPYDIQVLEGRALVPQVGDSVLGRSGKSPIAVSGRRPEGAFLALGFDPRKSDFVLRAAFPLFVDNVIQFLSPAPLGQDGQSLRVGAVTKVRVAGDSVQMVGPLGSPNPTLASLPTVAGEATLRVDVPGFYRLEEEGGHRLLSANYFDTEEATLSPRSNLSDVRKGSVTSVQPSDSSSRRGLLGSLFGRRAPMEPWMSILLFVCAVSLVEWWTYHRRLTV